MDRSTVVSMAIRRRIELAVAVLAGLALLAIVAVVAVAALVDVTANSSNDPRTGVDADTARFTYGGRSVEVPLEACGRDGDVVLMAGRAGSVVVQVWADLGEGGRESTGVTADLGDEGILGAFGADIPPGPAGEIVSVGTVGDGLVIEGRWTTFDENIQPTDPGDRGGEIETLVARCPAPDES